MTIFLNIIYSWICKKLVDFGLLMFGKLLLEFSGFVHGKLSFQIVRNVQSSEVCASVIYSFKLFLIAKQ